MVKWWERVLRDDHIAMGNRMYCNACRKQIKTQSWLEAYSQGGMLSMPTITSTLQKQPGWGLDKVSSIHLVDAIHRHQCPKRKDIILDRTKNILKMEDSSAGKDGSKFHYHFFFSLSYPLLPTVDGRWLNPQYIIKREKSNPHPFARRMRQDKVRFPPSQHRAPAEE